MLMFLANALTIPPRQTQETWQAWGQLKAPFQLKEYIHQAVWQRQPMGDRIQAWRPQDLLCPLDHHVESIAHAVSECVYELAAFGVIAPSFHNVVLPDDFIVTVPHLLTLHPCLSLQYLPRLLALSPSYTN